ncbi:MAG: hypothetical protein AVDCRST_MAG03-494 [uncultured Rubrobacteraceae bacterium]|uniref:Uncharacterized protein n=1 Tax=uncultured Rubrobacteraceae bacterium TaxID=349277 RepID=A0A6J4NJE7_9ACTN|nr:MAG: hypothetical protein AVDCRST_MAG03-494 [uncultured Rubrobacteraceae bacterium]
MGVHRYAMTDQDLNQRVADAARGQLGERSWNAARSEGRAMTFEEAVAYALEGEDGSPDPA